MKVNISGVGLVPRVGLLAPVYGKDLTKDTISQIIRYQSFKVYVASSGAQITKSNIDEIFGNVSKIDETVPTPASPKKKAKEVATEEKVEEKIIGPVIEETTVDVVSKPLPEITEDPETEEKTADFETVNEESSVDATEEAPVTETNPYRNNKKKKRH